jgi:type I restriction enzyme S subunit
LYGGEMPFIQTADIQSALVKISSYSQTYSEEGVAQSKVWDQPTLCLTIAGENTGSTAILDFPACFPDSIVGFVPDPEKADLTFVKHALDAMRSQFRMVSRGATQDNLSLEKILSFPLRIPPLPIQKKISSIVGGYNELIENNRRRIALLEEAARMLYREWFVHFRFPCHEHVKIIDGLPEGWVKLKISDLFVTYLGGTPARGNANFWGGDVPWINSGEINKLRIVQASEFISEEGLSRSAAKLMPVGTTVLAITGATLGQVSYLEIESSANQSVVGVFDEQRRLNELAYLFFKENAQKLVHLGSGGAQQHINKDIVNGLEFVRPNEPLTRIFQETVAPIFYQVRNLMFQNMKLSEARDLLLPRLMNGEIAV